MWHEGSFLIQSKDRKETTVVHYWAKVYDEGSPFGINEGRISKLTLKANDEVIFRYDRGLDIPPQSEAAEIALVFLLHEYK